MIFEFSFAEFLDQTRKQEFQRDPGWNTIEDEPVYTQQEYMEFEHRRQMEIQRLIDQGLVRSPVSLHALPFVSLVVLMCAFVIRLHGIFFLFIWCCPALRVMNLVASSSGHASASPERPLRYATDAWSVWSRSTTLLPSPAAAAAHGSTTNETRPAGTACSLDFLCS